jgi:LacI family transcriptional regulator
MAKRPQVALLVETSNAYARGLLCGINAYMREHRPWSIILPERGRGDAPLKWLRTWRGDGIIARIETRRIAAIVREMRAPTVNVGAARLVPEFPSVETDNRAIARLAFAHLFERGFRSLAYCGERRFPWSLERGHWFADMARKAGCMLAVYPSADSKHSSTAPWDQDLRELTEWIRQLPRPCGMMVCHDYLGRQVLDICRGCAIAVPDELAVVGVDNDDLFCNMSDPPLTSVAPDTHRAGYQAAELLDQMMAGRKLKKGSCLIEPTGIITRTSSDVFATDDAEVSAAVRVIREHACDGIKVQDVMRMVPLSLRILESRFKRIVGHSMQEEILRVRLQRVKQLLAETDLSQASIAKLTGFKVKEYLSRAFRQRFRQTPGQYRTDRGGLSQS